MHLEEDFCETAVEGCESKPTIFKESFFDIDQHNN